MSKTTRRPLAAFCLAPAVPALIAWLVAVASGSRDEFAWGFLIFAAASYLAALMLGVPTYFFLRRRGISQAAPYPAAGAVIGLASEFVFAVIPVLLFKNPEHRFTVSVAAALGFSALAMASGAIAGFVFWLVGIA